ncbi:hypothetical protein WS88_18745 [Burkholderia cepacia]|nr:hypothetical protein WS88_18745 [Burkholderia cepacia]
MSCPIRQAGVAITAAAVMTVSAFDLPLGLPTAAGVAIALASNLVNNLSAGLIASSTVDAARSTQAVIDASLIGVDLGPNPSVTGSLATILWLAAIRREG